MKIKLTNVAMIQRSLRASADAEDLANQHLKAATTPTERDRARDEMKAARALRKSAVTRAESELVKAKAGLDAARSRNLDASAEKWRARYDRIKAAIGEGGQRRSLTGSTSTGKSTARRTVSHKKTIRSVGQSGSTTKPKKARSVAATKGRNLYNNLKRELNEQQSNLIDW